MPPLQVKDFPADVYERLRQCAREENRSISQQALTIIEDYLNMRDNGLVSVRAVNVRMVPASVTYVEEGSAYTEKHRRAIERINELPPIPITDTAPCSVEILRQIREEEAK